jgi:Arc/MetJ family transcription regulator
MRTTLILDDDLIAKAAKLTGVDEKTKLIHMGLEALIHRESSKRLAAIGGIAPDFEVAARRNTDSYSGFVLSDNGTPSTLKIAEPTPP